jgi:CRISPR-associated protein Csy3
MAKRTSSGNVHLPTVLSYERSIHPTTAVFYAARGEAREPIRVIAATTLGVRADPMDPAKSDDYDYASGNPQRGEVAMLPADCDTLEIVFNVTVSPSSLAPHACDVPAFRRLLIDYTQAFRDAAGYEKLAGCYAVNIASGRWAWRNRALASAFNVEVNLSRHTKAISFDAFEFDLHDLDVPQSAEAGIATLASHIAEGLKGPKPTIMSVRGCLSMAAGSVVWPSQEFAERGSDTDLGKVLFKFPLEGRGDATGFHEQKVGAAIRTIDTWHKGISADGHEAVAPHEPLCVNPYGQHRDAHVVVRDVSHNGSSDFYKLLKEHVARGKSGVTDDDCFVIANLVRGGVFPVGGKKEG